MKFLTVVGVYTGYCQICHEPRMVGRMALQGWLYEGTACVRCLLGLAEEVDRRGSALVAGPGGTEAHPTRMVQGGAGEPSANELVAHGPARGISAR